MDDWYFDGEYEYCVSCGYYAFCECGFINHDNRESVDVDFDSNESLTEMKG